MNRRAAQRKRVAQRRRRIGIVLGLLVVAAVGGFVLAAAVDDAAEESAPDGRRIYADNCSTCHGERGEGLFTFPRLAGVVQTKYPNVEDQIALVRNGRNQMPAFGGELEPEEIRAVVEFTRSALR